MVASALHIFHRAGVAPIRPNTTRGLSLGDELHQQPVVPLLAAGVALVAPHHADPLEPRLLVGADRSYVRRRGVDRDAVMAPVVDEVTDDAPERRSADALTVERRVEKQVDAGEAVAGLQLLVVLDQAGDAAVDLDRQPG